jgi:hypothetical protein
VQEYAQATMVEEAALRDGLTTTISRTEVEEALALEEPPELVLDISGTGEGPRSIAVSWKRDDLERLLREATGEQIQLTFDRAAIEQALDDDVEAHGMRQKAAILAVALTAAAGYAGTAHGMPVSQGPGTGGAPVSLNADPTDGGRVDPNTGVMRVVEQPATGGDSSSFSDLAPAAAAVGGVAVLAIAGAAFALGSGGNRRRPAAT